VRWWWSPGNSSNFSAGGSSGVAEARVLQRGAAQGSFDRADPTRGRFRSFLLGAVKHFLRDRRTADERLKRGGGVMTESLEALAAPGSSLNSAAGLQVEDVRDRWDVREFDRHWATTLTARAVSVLENEFIEEGRSLQFNKLKPWLMGDGGLKNQAAAAVELEMTEGAVKVAIHRLRKRFRDAVRSEMGDTVPDTAQIDDELRYLISVLGKESVKQIRN